MKKLRKYDFNAVRVPVSAPSREPLLDVFTTKSDTILAFEVKRSKLRENILRKSQRFIYLYENLHCAVNRA